MANPQKENGHIEVANDLWEALTQLEIPGRQRRVFDAIIRKTWGWGKKKDHVPISQLAAMTKIDHAHVCHMLAWLKAADMIVRDETGMTAIQKDYDRWKLPEGGVPRAALPSTALPRKATASAAKGTGGSAAGGTLKRQCIKTTIQKKRDKGDSALSPKQKKELFVTGESQTMNEKIDESFPRKRRYGNEGMNWMLDYYEHLLGRKPQKTDAYQKRFLIHLKRELGYGRLREVLEWIASPGCWWGDKIIGFDQIWYKRETLQQQMERRTAQVDVGGELIEEKEITNPRRT